MQLLSDPLPPDVPLPASAQQLLLHLFDNAVQGPSVHSLEPVYLLLDGACEDLLDILPQAGLDKLRDNLTKIMRSVKSVEEQMLSLYCLAIIVKLNNHHKSGGECTDHPRSGVSAHSYKEISKFFRGDKAQKTVPLLALQMVYACRPDGPGSPDHDRLRGARLGRQVLEAVEPAVREAWARDKANVATVKKLLEKVSQPGLPWNVQLEALTFVSMFSREPREIPKSVIGAFQRLLLNGADSNPPRVVEACLYSALPGLIAYFDEFFWTALLRALFHTTTKADGVDNAQYMLLLLRHIRSALGEHLSVRASVARLIHSNDIGGLLETFLGQRAGSETSLESCLCAFLLELITHTTNQEPDAAPSLFGRLLAKLEHTQTAPSRAPQIDHTGMNSDKIDSLSIVEESSTPEELGASHRWRQKLCVELRMDSKQRQQSIVQLVGRVCQDLENRCENNEAPLRAEQAKVEALQRHNQELQQNYAALEDQWLARGSELQEAQMVNDRVRLQLQEAAEKNETLTARLDDLQNQMDSADADATRLLSDTKRRLEGQMLELQGTLAFQTEKIDDYEMETANIRDQLNDKGSDLSAEQEAHATTRSALNENIRNLQDEMKSKEAESQQQALDLQACRNGVESLNGKINVLEQNVRDAETAREALKTTHQTATDSMQTDMDALQARHRSDIETTTSNAAKEQRALQQQLDKMHQDHQQYLQQLDSEARSKDLQIQGLRSELRHCTSDLQDKISQLEQAEEWRAQMFAAFKNQEPAHGLPRKTKRAMAQSPAKIGSRRPSRSRVEEVTAPFEDDHIEAKQVEASSSYGTHPCSTQSPSPKRVKPPPSERTPATKHATFAPTTRSTKMIRSRRSLGLPALGETSGSRLNGLLKDRRRSEAPVRKDHDLENEEDENMSDEVTPFSKASSPYQRPAQVQSRASGRGANVEERIYDDLVADDFDATTVEL